MDDLANLDIQESSRAVGIPTLDLLKSDDGYVQLDSLDSIDSPDSIDSTNSTHSLSDFPPLDCFSGGSSPPSSPRNSHSISYFPSRLFSSDLLLIQNLSFCSANFILQDQEHSIEA